MAAAWDLIVINLLTLVTCIPVITIGASLTAMYHVLIKRIRGEESYISRDFFRAFRSNFVQSTILWLMAAALIISFRADLFIIRENPQILGTGVRIAVYVAAIICFMIWQFVFPLQSHFENPVLITLKNAVILAISRFFPSSLVMSAVWIVPWLLFRYSMMAFPLLLLFGISLPGFICAKMADRVFRPFEPEKEAEDDAAFAMSEEELTKFKEE